MTKARKTLLAKVFTQSVLADRLGVSRQAVSAWFSGEAKPETKTMAEIDRIYGIPMRSWFEEEAEDDKEPASERKPGPKGSTAQSRSA